MTNLSLLAFAGTFAQFFQNAAQNFVNTYTNPTTLIFELVGIAASATLLISFLMNSARKIRIINVIGAALFVVYGFLVGAYAMSVMNVVLIVVNVVKLAKEKKKANEQPKQEQSKQDLDNSTTSTED